MYEDDEITSRNSTKLQRFNEFMDTLCAIIVKIAFVIVVPCILLQIIKAIFAIQFSN